MGSAWRRRAATEGMDEIVLVRAVSFFREARVSSIAFI